MILFTPSAIGKFVIFLDKYGVCFINSEVKKTFFSKKSDYNLEFSILLNLYALKSIAGKTNDQMMG